MGLRKRQESWAEGKKTVPGCSVRSLGEQCGLCPHSISAPVQVAQTESLWHRNQHPELCCFQIPPRLYVLPRLSTYQRNVGYYVGRWSWKTHSNFGLYTALGNEPQAGWRKLCLHLLLSIELEVKPRQKYNCSSAITEVNLTECFNEKNIFQNILMGGLAWFCNF